MRPWSWRTGDEAMEFRQGKVMGNITGGPTLEECDAITGNTYAGYDGNMCITNIDMDIVYYGEWSGFVGEHLGLKPQP